MVPVLMLPRLLIMKRKMKNTLHGGPSYPYALTMYSAAGENLSAAGVFGRVQNGAGKLEGFVVRIGELMLFVRGNKDALTQR